MSVQPPAALVSALRHVLRPLVRLMLHKGVSWPQLAELLKELFVDVAAREMALPGKPQTDSRITLLTGVHRKDVKRLRAQQESRGTAFEEPEAVSLGMRVVSAWSEPPFADADGMPAPLHRLASQGGARSFEELVASVSKDIRARALLDEWLRLGVVRQDENLRIVLEPAAFVPSGDLEQQAWYLGHNLHDHAAAAVTNLVAGRGVFLERSVHHDGLRAETVLELAAEAERNGMKLLHGLNRKSLAARAATRRRKGDTGRYTFGIYFYSEAAAEAGEGSAAAPAAAAARTAK